MKIINVVGARPNFMKMAPIIEAMNRHPGRIEHLLVHTGQHYDQKMSQAFFDDLGMPVPDIDLGIGSGSHAEQTGRIMIAFEKVCEEHRPELVVVVGDVNSTMACTITAKKLGIKVAHVEAGLRSRDMSMPEEINRLCTDVLCDYLFTTDRIADRNLEREGVPPERIFFVGNVMIDTLLKHRAMAAKLGLLAQYGLQRGGYATLTLHRPSNVDDPAIFAGIMQAITAIAREIPIIFPIHPRTRKTLENSPFTYSRFTIDPYGAPRLPGVPAFEHERQTGPDRQWRAAGRDHRARRPLHHHARQYRAADHLRGRHQRAGRQRSGRDPGGGPADPGRRNRQRPGAGVVGRPRGGADCRYLVEISSRIEN